MITDDIAVHDNWPFDTIVPYEDGAIYDLIIGYETQLDRLDVQADELMEQRFIDTATTRELEKLAAEVGVTRQTNESEERFRFRTRIAKAVTRSTGTIDSFATVLFVIFGDDVKEISIDTPPDEPVVQLIMPSDLVDEMPLTTDELEDELIKIIPTADGLEIITDDMWILGESGDQGIGKGELT